MNAYHGTAHNLTFEELFNNASSTIGWHFGSLKAAVVAVNKYDSTTETWNNEQIQDFFNDNPECFIEVEISSQKKLAATDSEVNSEDFMNAAISSGYDCVEYKNEFEDIGSLSYVVLNSDVLREL